MRRRGGGHVRTARLLAACAVGVLGAVANVASPAAAAHGRTSATVVVDATSFDPFKTEVSPEGTVTWDVRQSGHTIVADDGRFEFFGPDGGAIPAGETRSFAVGETEEVIRYHCTIHGVGMAGAIVVGHPKPLVDDPTVIAVPGDDPGNSMSIEGAVAAAIPGTRIEIAPGRYTVPERVEVDLRDPDELPQGVTIVGMGEGPSEVVIDIALVPQQGLADAVFHVTGAFVTLRNLTVEARHVSGAGAGIHLDGAHQAALEHVIIDGAGWARDGVRITEASGAALRAIAVAGVRGAGIHVEACAACGVRITDADLSGGLVGVLASGARGISLRDSTIAGNAAGVVARRDGARLSTIEIAGNHIAANDRRDQLPANTDADRGLAAGAGVWLDGTADSLVARNHIAGNTFGVAVSGGARQVTVAANTLIGNGTDLLWDGIGASTCFADHHRDVTTAPMLLTELYPCGRPTVGVPYPVVNLMLLLAAYS